MNLAGGSDAVLELLRSSSHVEFVAQTVGRFDAVATLGEFPSGLQNTFRPVARAESQGDDDDGN